MNKLIRSEVVDRRKEREDSRMRAMYQNEEKAKKERKKRKRNPNRIGNQHLIGSEIERRAKELGI